MGLGMGMGNGVGTGMGVGMRGMCRQASVETVVPQGKAP